MLRPGSRGPSKVGQGDVGDNDMGHWTGRVEGSRQSSREGGRS